jgi:hypothetical protein
MYRARWMHRAYDIAVRERENIPLSLIILDRAALDRKARAIDLPRSRNSRMSVLRCKSSQRMMT